MAELPPPPPGADRVRVVWRSGVALAAAARYPHVLNNFLHRLVRVPPAPPGWRQWWINDQITGYARAPGAPPSAHNLPYVASSASPVAPSGPPPTAEASEAGTPAAGLAGTPIVDRRP